jgi:hypothetical protein
MEFPRQNIPERDKNEEWHSNTVDAIVSQSRQNSRYLSSRKNDHENYLIVNGDFDGKQFEYVTDMYGITAPARLVNYPIILPKLDLLAGELISQPLQYTVNVINRNAIRRKNEKRTQIAAEVVLKPIRREIEKVLGMPIPDEDLGEEIPEDVDAYTKMKFRDHIEEMVYTGLSYCHQKWGLEQVFKRGFYDLGITGKEFYRIYVKNGDPYVERCDPRSMLYDIDSDKENIKDSKYAGVENWYTVNEILDTYNLYLSKEQVEEIEDLESQDSAWYQEQNSEYDNYTTAEGENMKVRVVDVQWRSFRNVKYKVSPNKYDESMDYHKRVKDDYKAKKGEKIVTKVTNDIRQAVKIGHSILIKWGRKPNQVRYEENYSNTSLDFFGAIRNNFNGQTLSVVDSLKNIQILYNIVMYQIELALARSGSKAIVYDVSQKPKNVPLEDVMYHAKNSGLILINSRQEGMSNFNQFQSIDFTLSQSVSQMTNLKIMLEDTADKLTGISAARAGISKSGDLVGVTERNVMQSTLITAPLFDLHYNVVGDVLQGLCGLMKSAWGNEGRMANVFGDMGMQTFKIDKSIALDEYGIFIENSGREVQRKQSMLALMDRYASSGNLDPLAAIKAVNADNATEIESILTQGLEAVNAQVLDQQEQATALQEQTNQINQEKTSVTVKVAEIKAEADIEVQRMKNEADLGMAQSLSEHKEDMQGAERRAELDNTMLQGSVEEQEELEEDEQVM